MTETRETSKRHTDILNAYREGDSPFVAFARDRLGDIRLDAWERGRVSLTWEIDERFVMPDGVVFGGHIAAVADHIAGLAAMTALDRDEERFRTSRLETTFFRPLTPPRGTIAGRVVNASRRLIHVEADIVNFDGKLAARIAAVQMRRTAEPR